MSADGQWVTGVTYGDRTYRYNDDAFPVHRPNRATFPPTSPRMSDDGSIIIGSPRSVLRFSALASPWPRNHAAGGLFDRRSGVRACLLGTVRMSAMD